MKKWILVLLTLIAFCSLAQAQSSSVGLRAGFPTLFSVVYGLDFEAPQRGLGARFILTGFALPVFGGNPGISVLLAAEVLYRVPIEPLGLNVHAGLGVGAGVGGLGTANLRPVFLLYPNLGLELSLFRGLSFTIDFQPIYGTNYIGDFRIVQSVGLALGLSYRF